MLDNIVKMVDAVEDGKANPLDVYAELDQLIKNIDKAKEQIFDEAMKEAEKYKDKTFKHKGFEFTRRVGGGRYNYKGVPKHVEMKSKLTAFEKLMQLAYKAYHNGGGQMADNEGEVVPIPEYKNNKDSISVKKLDI